MRVEVKDNNKKLSNDGYRRNGKVGVELKDIQKKIIMLDQVLDWDGWRLELDLE